LDFAPGVSFRPSPRAAIAGQDALPFWVLFERVGLHAAVIDWPSLAQRPIRAPVVEPVAVQRFNGAGRARDRIVKGLVADLSTVEAISAAASNRNPTLVVGALNGFEEAQRAIHIFTNDLPPRSTMKGESSAPTPEQLDSSPAPSRVSFRIIC
jgi:hypothetical protein